MADARADGRTCPPQTRRDPAGASSRSCTVTDHLSRQDEPRRRTANEIRAGLLRLEIENTLAREDLARALESRALRLAAAVAHPLWAIRAATSWLGGRVPVR